MNRDERLCKIYLKWFKLGFNEHIKCLHNPNRWLGVNKAFDIDYDYEATFVESLPWNNRWTWRGYRDGYYFVDPFNYANKMPDDSCIKEFFSYYMIDNQYGLGAKYISSPCVAKLELNPDSNEEDTMNE